MTPNFNNTFASIMEPLTEWKSHSTHSKDFIGFLIMMFSLTLLSLWNPYMLGDSENYIPANPLLTPVHIQPEWYFLLAYTILRSIPNKLLGLLL